MKANLKEPRRRGCGYVRMSSSQQEKSPARQRKEILAMAEREGIEIVAWYLDEAVSGDSGPMERSGFRDMLQAAKDG